MLTFKDITLLVDDIDRKNIGTEAPEWQRVLWKYDVRDCQTLFEHVQSGNPDFQNNKIDDILYAAFKLTIKMNETDMANPIHIFRTSENEEIENAIRRIDLTVTVDELPHNYLFEQSDTKAGIKKANIASAKYFLGKVDVYGKNSIQMFFDNRRPLKTKSLIKGIEFYNRFLEHVAANTPNLSSYDGNLFRENEREKLEIVRDNLGKILEYLCENGTEFIWGRIGNESRTILSRAIRLNRNYPYKARFERVLANYTTLGELEGDFLEDGTLKRFIMQPKSQQK